MTALRLDVDTWSEFSLDLTDKDGLVDMLLSALKGFFLRKIDGVDVRFPGRRVRKPNVIG